MRIALVDQPDVSLMTYLDQKIAEFNGPNWEVSNRMPIAVQVTNEQGDVVAGSAGQTFGNWLLIKTLWVHESLRGQNYGSQILEQMEQGARARGCHLCLLDTLGFQARPFYEARGYQVQWTQSHYPATGSKYFMVKALTEQGMALLATMPATAS